jgi:hypothetical protein
VATSSKVLAGAKRLENLLSKLADLRASINDEVEQLLLLDEETPHPNYERFEWPIKEAIRSMRHDVLDESGELTIDQLHIGARELVELIEFGMMKSQPTAVAA